MAVSSLTFDGGQVKLEHFFTHKTRDYEHEYPKDSKYVFSTMSTTSINCKSINKFIRFLLYVSYTNARNERFPFLKLGICIVHN